MEIQTPALLRVESCVGGGHVSCGSQRGRLFLPFMSLPSLSLQSWGRDKRAGVLLQSPLCRGRGGRPRGGGEGHVLPPQAFIILPSKSVLPMMLSGSRRLEIFLPSLSQI